MRCQYVLIDNDHCPKAGVWRVLFRLPNHDKVLVFTCNAHASALEAVEWAERKRNADHHDHPD